LFFVFFTSVGGTSFTCDTTLNYFRRQRRHKDQCFEQKGERQQFGMATRTYKANDGSRVDMANTGHYHRRDSGGTTYYGSPILGINFQGWDSQFNRDEQPVRQSRSQDQRPSNNIHVHALEGGRQTHQMDTALDHD